jgi:hypothetical protein
MNLRLVSRASLPVFPGTNARNVRDRAPVLAGKSLPIAAARSGRTNVCHSVGCQLRAWVVYAAHNGASQLNAETPRVSPIRRARVPAKICQGIVGLVTVVVACLKTWRARADECREHERVKIIVPANAAIPKHYAPVAASSIPRAEGAIRDPAAHTATAPSGERSNATLIADLVVRVGSNCFPYFHVRNHLIWN